MFDGILSVILYLIAGTLLFIVTVTLLTLSLFRIYGSLESMKCYNSIPHYKARPILSYWEWLIRAYRQKSVRAWAPFQEFPGEGQGKMFFEEQGTCRIAQRGELHKYHRKRENGAILEILEDRQIIDAEELILNEEDEFNEFTKCPGFHEDGENFVPEEFAPEPREYIPLWYKKNAVALAEAYILRVLHGICKAYGKEGVAMIWIGLKPVIILFKPETVEPLLNSSRTISKAAEYRFLEPWLGTGLLTSDGDKWRTHRRLLTPAFHFQILDTFLSVINEESSVLTKKLEAEVEKPWTDIVPMITMFTLDTICQTAMGVHLNIQSGCAKDYIERIDQISETFFYRTVRPWLWPDFCFLYCSPTGWRFRKNVQHIHEFTRKVIKEKKECMLKEDFGCENDEIISGKPRKKPFLELLLQVHLKDSSFTEENIREEVDTFMFEGHDTTAMSISFTLYLLGRYPDVQEKILQELYEIFGNDKEREITSDDLKKMKYLECAIKESLRLYPSVPIIARHLTENLNIGDHSLKPGCTCTILVFVLHLDQEQFRRPKLFDPDRFLPENSSKRHPFSYIPFSAGPRNCIGQRFALMEEKTALAHILRKFKVASLDPCDQVETMASLILKNVRPIRIHFELRENIQKKTT